MRRFLPWLGLAAVLPLGCGRGDASREAAKPGTVPDSVKTELIEMGIQDQAARGGLTPEMVQDSAFMRRMLQGDSARTRRLREVIDQYGWPTEAAVGPEAAQAAFLILQHSQDNDFQASMVPQLQELAEEGAMPRSDVALLVDRVLVHEGKPQRYGTQFSLEGGKLVMDPVEDEEGLEARRQEMGLPPMDEYKRMLEEQYRTTVSGGH